jgi:hypothetical protein
MLEDLTPTVKIFSCKVRNLIGELEAKDSEILKDAVDDDKAWRAKTLSDQLRNLGIQLGQESIRRHRAKVCSCFNTSNQR